MCFFCWITPYPVNKVIRPLNNCSKINNMIILVPTLKPVAVNVNFYLGALSTLIEGTIGRRLRFSDFSRFLVHPVFVVICNYIDLFFRWSSSNTTATR